MWRRLLLITGLAALLAYLLRRHPSARPVVQYDLDPAEELRRKLNEARDRETPEEAELAEDLDARRREVHDRGRASADEMRGSASE
jgi:hypothetical protein